MASDAATPASRACEQRRTRRGVSTPARPGPERPDERQPGHRGPLLAEIDLRHARAPRDRGTARVADEQRGVAARAASRSRSGAIGTNSGSMPNALAAEHAQQRVRRPRAGVERDRCGCRSIGLVREQRHRRDRPVGDDRRCPARCGTARPRRYSIDGIIPRSIEPSCSSAAHFDGDVEAQREQLGPQLEPVDERPRVQVVDGAETDQSSDSASAVRRRSRRSGRCARPARAPPRGCCRGSLRARCGACPSVPGSTAATPSTSSAPIVSATCASFGP